MSGSYLTAAEGTNPGREKKAGSYPNPHVLIGQTWS